MQFDLTVNFIPQDFTGKITVSQVYGHEHDPPFSFGTQKDEDSNNRPIYKSKAHHDSI
jgi:hypothetical protein